jgi:hypothetical protein
MTIFISSLYKLNYEPTSTCKTKNISNYTKQTHNLNNIQGKESERKTTL